MAASNLERVGKALELLNTGLKPFVERELQGAYRQRWLAEIEADLHEYRRPAKRKKVDWDTQALLGVMWNHWNAVFKNTLGFAERSLVSELRDVRNRWAHQKAFTTEDTYRALDSIVRLLDAVAAPQQAAEVRRLLKVVLQQRYEEMVRKEFRSVTAAPLAGKPPEGLKPWREVVQPHPDVASGGYLQAEFAADLWQVHLKQAADEYQDPEEFYRRTYLTEGLRTLLAGALRRLNGEAGDPVVDLQTNFGGGKTHSMLALYHLFSGTPAGQLPGIEGLVREVGVSTPPKVRRAVLVGTRIPAGQAVRKKDGTGVRTLWGELAWQLGGREAYEMIHGSDETGTSPGDELRRVIEKYSPCLILIDEWVAYARQLYGHGRELPGGSLEAQFTFAHALSEAVKAVPRAMLVVSLPVSAIEVGGEGGKVALEELRRIIHRVEAAWRPAGMEESFEIVRRRLFQPITDPDLSVARDAVIRAFGEFYRNQAAEFPNECREAAYERRMRQCYPIHPELFERLYQDWGSLEAFQLTRGVLRLLAAVIHTLWEREDRNLLILPAQVPVDVTPVQNELMRYLPDAWRSVIGRDVDGAASLPLKLDGENPNFGKYSACRRVARTLFIGSAPTERASRKGLDDRHLRLGSVQPGEQVAVFGDALRRLVEQATHVYTDGGRYWLSTQPSINRVAKDRAAQYKRKLDEVHQAIEAQVRQAVKRPPELAGVHPFPASTADVPDEMGARLVILSPEHPHTAKRPDSDAMKEARRILAERGSSPRVHANTLLFLSADAARLEALEDAICLLMAWESILRDKEALDLTVGQQKQAEDQKKAAERAVGAQLLETYCWLLAPVQPDPKGSVEWEEARLKGTDSLVQRVVRELGRREWLYVAMGGVRLRMELDRIPLWRGDHVKVKQLAEDFARYLYLPRLRDSGVLVKAVEEGVNRLTWREDTFAYAEAFDEASGRYRGLVAGRDVRVLLDDYSVVVKPEVAARQLQQERKEEPRPVPPGEGTGVEPTPPGPEPPPPAPPTPPRRFYGSVKLDATRLNRDAKQIAEEVVQHVARLPGATVEVTLEIKAEVPDGAPADTIRVVSENCRTLKFSNFGFERE